MKVWFWLFFLSLSAFAQTDREIENLRKFHSPVIEGEVLKIQGKIDSHIYDFLSYEASKLKTVTTVELNSFGGNITWALEVAKIVQRMKLKTRVVSGSFCASACVFIFGAGREREAATDIWFGIHGARHGAGYAVRFNNLCFEEEQEAPNLAKEGCQEFLREWHRVTLKVTEDSFALIEESGVSAELRETYLGMEDSKEWYRDYNVIRKPDWALRAADAVRFKLVTKLLNQ